MLPNPNNSPTGTLKNLVVSDVALLILTKLRIPVVSIDSRL
jgi:hypothetical protein